MSQILDPRLNHHHSGDKHTMTDPSPSPSPFSTPKRKRTHVLLEDAPSPTSTHQQFSFDLSNIAGSVPASGSSSPRTKVAHRFRGLALGDHHGGGGVAAAQGHQGHQGPPQRSSAADSDTDSGAAAAAATDRMQIDEDESKMRKRTRTSVSPAPNIFTDHQQDRQAQISDESRARESPRSTTADPTLLEPRVAATHDDSAVDSSDAGQVALDPTVLTSSPKPSPAKLSKPTPASNRPLESLKNRGRKRAGTPPLSSKRNSKSTAVGPVANDGEVAEIIDPIRAALTWHEDEITVYDPEDEDDDGVGINGIGFKPTPAIAYARTQKRRQQLAEYRKREEREARARRSHRRRGASPDRSSAVPAKPEANDSGSAARKVRFNEAENSMMIETI